MSVKADQAHRTFAGRPRRPGSKPHLIVDRHGTPLVVSLTSGNRHDVTQLLSLLDFIPRLRGLGGRLRHRLRRLFADRCYDFDKYRRVLRARGITPKIARHGTLHGSGLGKTRWVAVTNRAHGPAATRPALGYLGGAGAERAPAFGSVRSSGSDKRGALSGLRLIAVGRVDQQRRHVQGDVLELFRRVGASVPADDHAEAHGALGITLPACPFCERTIPLRFRRDDARCCRRCYDKTRLQDCSRCGNGRNVVTRAADGQPLCGNCMKADPHFHEVCRSCGQLAFTIRHDDQGQGICDACWRPPVAICSVCGNHKPCHYANSEAPRCANCTARLVRGPCSYCGTTHEVYARTADGGALCPPCSRRREPCSICANLRYVSSRTPDGRPLCGRCFRKSPLSFRECVECGDTSRLHRFGLCPKCAAPRQLRSLLTGPDGEVRPELVPVLSALAASNPHSLLIRLRNPGTPPSPPGIGS